jgi:hypothetical protein
MNGEMESLTCVQGLAVYMDGEAKQAAVADRDARARVAVDGALAAH